MITGFYGGICLVLKEASQLSSKAAVPFAFPPTVNENSCCSTSSKVCAVVGVLGVGPPDRCVVVFPYRFILHSPDDI